MTNMHVLLLSHARWTKRTIWSQTLEVIKFPVSQPTRCMSKYLFKTPALLDPSWQRSACELNF
jgi:hypothetical protein